MAKFETQKNRTSIPVKILTCAPPGGIMASNDAHGNNKLGVIPYVDAFWTIFSINDHYKYQNTDFYFHTCNW